MSNISDFLNSKQQSMLRSMYQKAAQDFPQHCLEKAQQYSDTVFAHNLETTDINHYINSIKGSGGLFEKLIKYVNKSNRITSCKAIFNYCEMSQDWRQVGIWLKEEIEQLEIANNLNIQESAWLYFAYGRYLEETGKLNLSFKYHQKGIAISQINQDEFNLALNYLGCGVTLQRFTNKKDIEEAINYLDLALDIFKKFDNQYQQANTLLNLGSSYDRLEQWNQSIESYQQGIKILKMLNNQFDLGRTLYSLGIVYLRSNQFKEGEDAFNQGKECCEQSQNNYYKSLIYYGLGWLEYRKNKFDLSQEYLEESIRQFNKHKEDYLSSSEASFYESEGNIYLLTAASYSKTPPIDIDKVSVYLDKAEQSFQKLDHPDIKLTHVLANRARLYEYTEDWTMAKTLFYQLFEKGKRLKNKNPVSGKNTMSDAAIHLFRIYLNQRTSILEWLEFPRKLGLSGLWCFFLGFLARMKSTQKIAKYLTK
jgi:tetratricopeptide (TPR) repeat protein